MASSSLPTVASSSSTAVASTPTPPLAPTAPLLSALSHVVVPAGPDRLAVATEFYHSVLGFETGHRDPSANDESEATDGRWLVHFDADICLYLDESLRGPTEVAFVSSRLQDLRDLLKSREVACDAREANGLVIELRCADPAGNRIVIHNRVNPLSGVDRPQAVARVVESHRPTPSPTPGVRKTIAVLTSGGDSVGMNAALRAIVRAGISRNCDVYAIHEGYQGMVSGGENMMHKFKWGDVTGIIGDGGTIIGTARSKEFRTPEGRLQAAYNLVSRGIDALVCIGGDGSLTGANMFRKEWPGNLAQLVKDGRITQAQADAHPVFSVVGMVGSIDNDMCGTDMTIGCDTALHRVMEALDSLASTAASHQRAFVVEVMGRNCGWLALWAALAAGADWLFIPEAPPEFDQWQIRMCDKLARIKSTGKRHLLVVLAEGAVDFSGQPIKAENLRALIETHVNIETRVTVLGHTQRGGRASYFDRFLSTMQGVAAIDAILTMTPDTPSPMIGMNGNAITQLPLVDCVEQTLAVGEALRAHNFKHGLELRGTEFTEAYRTFRTIARAEPRAQSGEGPNSVRFAIVHVGAPGGGVNSATRTATRLAVSRGHTVLAVRNGFDGLLEGQLEELDWMSVDEWAAKGGSKLGTSRTLPSKDYGMVAFYLQKFRVEALLIIGGFEGFEAMSELLSQRSHFPQFCIPMVLLPASISNNIPGTEISLGSDTALNIITQSCDQIKEAASSMTGRVYVVEVMGGQCGYLATAASLAGAGMRAYVPESGISFATLSEDIQLLKRKFDKERVNGRIILYCEDTSKTYTSEFVAALLDEEGRRCGLFEARSEHLGHLQQGGVPSPLDRYNGARWASLSIDFLEQTALKAIHRERLPPADVHFSTNRLRVFTDDPDTMVVLGCQLQDVKLTPIKQLLPEADMEHRRPKVQWWQSIIPVLRLLANYEK